MGSIAKKGLQQYLIQLQQHPLRTKAITAGVLSAISDIVAQKLTGIQKLQLRRLLLKVVVLEQLTSSPWNNLMFMIYYGVVVEVLASCGVDKSSICTTAVPCDFPQLSCNVLVNIVSPLICFLYMLAFLRYRGIFLNLRALPKAK
ncbi:peroxisomal membrane protein pmp22 [Citrus sinensis]|nr:peroxisomal membrane protein pmp22 [Citrus sinensis]